ncbi:hypothetical protein [Legionella qingyii]|uniref:hypothetical protein n=1 Tax=Legionella qingyii TaxID=2184757 RepID=UPI001F0C4AF6|nr:hypothetical protein [Legionella qingyii]
MGALFWWKPGKFFVITSYKLAKQILTREDSTCDRTPFFISRMPEMNLSLITDFFKVVNQMMVMSDLPNIPIEDEFVIIDLATIVWCDGMKVA